MMRVVSRRNRWRKVPLKELGDAELEISAWLTEGSRELIPETRGSILSSAAS